LCKVELWGTLYKFICKLLDDTACPDLSMNCHISMAATTEVIRAIIHVIKASISAVYGWREERNCYKLIGTGELWHMIWYGSIWNGRNSGKEVCISMQVGIQLSHNKWGKERKEKKKNILHNMKAWQRVDKAIPDMQPVTVVKVCPKR
jgi:hypothetical protein